MSEAFLKAIKWLILVECAICGTTAFIVSDATGSVAPIMVGVLAYGVVYIMSYFWKEFRDKLLLISISVFLVLTYVSGYVDQIMFILLGWPMEGYNEYLNWGAMVGIVGLPIMTLVFYKLD